MSGEAVRDPLERAQAIIEFVVGQLEPRVQQLRQEERQAEAHLAALQARAAEQERHLEQLRRAEAEVLAAAAGAAEVLKGIKADLEAQVQRLRQEAAEAQEQVLRLRTERAELEGRIEALRAEVARLEAEAAEALERAARAREQAAADEARAAAARAAAEAAIAHAQDAERRLAALRAAVGEAEEAAAAAEARVRALEQHYEELRAQGRPLKPYRPPEELPYKATMEVKFGNKLPNLDLYALQSYAEASGMEIKQILAEALRNYLPHEAYQVGLERMAEEARRAAEPVRLAPIGRAEAQAGGSTGGKDPTPPRVGRQFP